MKRAIAIGRVKRGAPLVLSAAIGLLAAGAMRAELPPEGACAGVYWDLTAIFDAGDRITARVLLTRVGPGDLNAAGQGHWRDPDGVTTPFQNGRTAGAFDLDATGRHVRIGSTELDLTGDAHTFEVDNDKRGVKLSVRFEGGEALGAPVHEGDLAIGVVHLGSRVEGRVWRRGMATPRSLAGRATLVRTTHRACERDLTALRADVHSLAGEPASLLIHERLAAGRDRNWFGWRGEDGALHSRHPEVTRLEAWREVGGERLPRRIRIEGDGMQSEIAIGSPLLAHDPLDALPRLVRMLYSFGAHPRRVWADATAEYSVAPEFFSPRGPALASFTFLREPTLTVPPPDGD